MTRTVCTSAGAPRKSRNIAIIDDDERFRRSLEQLLGAGGFRTQSYSSAEQFLECAKPRCIDCLVLDIYLDGMSGFDLQRYLAKSGNDLPIIFMTAHDDPGTSQMTRLAAPVAYLAKPFSWESLVAAIEESVASAPDGQGRYTRR